MKVKHSVYYFRNSAFLLTGIVLGILTCSCEEELPEPLFTSSVIQGRIELGYSSGGEGTPEDILVTASGPYGKQTGLTNSSGNFEITGLGNGTYKLEISKEGYGTKYQYGIQLFGDDTAQVRDELYERVEGTMPNLISVETQNTSFTWLHENSIAITTNFTATAIVPARAFMAEYNDVDYKHFQWTGEAHSLSRSGFTKMMFIIEGIPFESGKKIYVRLYICNPDEMYGYFNYYTGLYTFSTLEVEKHSQVMDFIMP